MPYAIWRQTRDGEYRSHPSIKQALGKSIVLLYKKACSHWFCVDYQGLNEIAKSDTFLLLWIDVLLDQLGGARFFPHLT